MWVVVVALKGIVWYACVFCGNKVVDDDFYDTPLYYSGSVHFATKYSGYQREICARSIRHVS